MNWSLAHIWNGSAFTVHKYVQSSGLWSGGGEPVLQVGQAFVIAPSTNSTWIQNYFDGNGIVPTLTEQQITSSNFIFSITGSTNSTWGVYSSMDLTNWTLSGDVTLNLYGSAFCTNNAISGVPYCFYKLTDGVCYSATIGFVRVTANPGYTAIADQLIAPDSTLNGLFPNGKSPDGMALPDQTQIQFWNGSAYATNIWSQSLGEWLPNGSATLSPGVGVFILNPTTNSFGATFVGQVSEGQSVLPLSTGNRAFISSMVPKSGGLQTALGYMPNNQDAVFIWNGSSLVEHKYVQSSGTWSGTGGEPVIQVGEGIFIEPSTNNEWIEYYFDND